jgi:hypothetical protein
MASFVIGHALQVFSGIQRLSAGRSEDPRHEQPVFGCGRTFAACRTKINIVLVDIDEVLLAETPFGVDVRKPVLDLSDVDRE